MRYGDIDGDACLSKMAIGRFIEQGRANLLLDAFSRAGMALQNGALGMLVARTDWTTDLLEGIR